MLSFPLFTYSHVSIFVARLGRVSLTPDERGRSGPRHQLSQYWRTQSRPRPQPLQHSDIPSFPLSDQAEDPATAHPSARSAALFHITHAAMEPTQQTQIPSARCHFHHSITSLQPRGQPAFPSLICLANSATWCTPCCTESVGSSKFRRAESLASRRTIGGGLKGKTLWYGPDLRVCTS